MAVFVDYDGTITDRDTFDVLMHVCAGPRQWERIESSLSDGTMTLREALQLQASQVCLSLEEAETAIARHARIEPSFAGFVRACDAHGAKLVVLSGGIGTLIGRAFARAGLKLEVRANDAEISVRGWRMTFRDDSRHGHDKALAIEEARARGLRTVYVGDGISDYEGAVAADVRFAKRGRSLERHLRDRGVPFTVFSEFDEVSAALWNGA
ncbi:MAG TPA: HAD-IB family phosphatase [Candidatus Acidoferrales bacterium]|nr:HAD-IB family phosphatase [Candidatus Acidoferrales bacterium]